MVPERREVTVIRWIVLKAELVLAGKAEGDQTVGELPWLWYKDVLRKK